MVFPRYENGPEGYGKEVVARIGHLEDIRQQRGHYVLEHHGRIAPEEHVIHPDEERVYVPGVYVVDELLEAVKDDEYGKRREYEVIDKADETTAVFDQDQEGLHEDHGGIKEYQK